jgi:hypothetical protein
MSQFELLSIHRAAEILGLQNVVIDTKAVIRAYSELAYNADEETLEVLKTARASLIIFDISDQMKETRHFIVDSDIDNPCPKCNGAGIMVKFKERTVNVTCHKCTDGKRIIDCPSCKGSGEKQVPDPVESDITVTIKCSRCKGKKKIQVKCRNCQGGIIKKPVKSHEVESYNDCSKCEGTGQYIPSEDDPDEVDTPQKSQGAKIDNPVIDNETGVTISQMIHETPQT